MSGRTVVEWQTERGAARYVCESPAEAERYIDRLVRAGVAERGAIKATPAAGRAMPLGSSGADAAVRRLQGLGYSMATRVDAGELGQTEPGVYLDAITAATLVAEVQAGRRLAAEVDAALPLQGRRAEVRAAAAHHWDMRPHPAGELERGEVPE